MLDPGALGGVIVGSALGAVLLGCALYAFINIYKTWRYNRKRGDQLCKQAEKDQLKREEDGVGQERIKQLIVPVANVAFVATAVGAVAARAGPPPKKPAEMLPMPIVLPYVHRPSVVAATASFSLSYEPSTDGHG